MNYFTQQDAARRYARSRPFFHPLVASRIQAFLKLDGPVSRALDVACGTGHSAVVLKGLAREVVGADASREMLGAASADAETADGIRYVEASAEALPFADESFELMTISMAFHWLDRASFLTEARRVLRGGAWLVIYNNWFTGVMRERAEFEGWHRESYLGRYPSPRRRREPFTELDAAEFKFHFAATEEYTNEVEFSVEELAGYLQTQSNVIAAVGQEGAGRVEEVDRWLTEELAPLFASPRATFLFGGVIWYLQKVA